MSDDKLIYFPGRKPPGTESVDLATFALGVLTEIAEYGRDKDRIAAACAILDSLGKDGLNR